jgi:hypothetical protein
MSGWFESSRDQDARKAGRESRSWFGGGSSEAKRFEERKKKGQLTGSEKRAYEEGQKGR